MCNAEFPVLDYSDYVYVRVHTWIFWIIFPIILTSGNENAIASCQCTHKWIHGIDKERIYKRGGDINEQVNQDRLFILHDQQDPHNFIMHHGCVLWAWGARSFCSPLFARGLDPIFLQEATRRYKWCAGMDGLIYVFIMMNHQIPPRFLRQSGSTASVIVWSSDKLT